MDDIVYMDLYEFYKLGYLQEANRLFFHPHGLALSMDVDEENKKASFAGIWDYRDDPEGIWFDFTGDHHDKAEFWQKYQQVFAERERHEATRTKLFREAYYPYANDIEPLFKPEGGENGDQGNQKRTIS